MEKANIESFQVKRAQKMSQFLKFEILLFPELKTERIPPVLRTSSGVQTYMLKDSRIRELIIHVVCKQSLPITLSNGVQFLQLLHSSSLLKARVQYEVRVAKPCEA